MTFPPSKSAPGIMDVQEQQARIDQIDWYHEFDFPNGLKVRSKTPDAEFHRRLWAFIQAQLDCIDFAGKSVLDLGCWDGYWSFYAERRGAKRVLATDDRTQNWAGSSGLLVAKELLGSSVEARLDVSAYEVTKLGEKFDIILCMGIYYHLVDPFYAFAQIRHCCRTDSIVIFEGDVTAGLRQNTLFYDLSDPSYSYFVPTHRTLNQMLGAAYFEVVSQVGMVERKPLNWRKRLRMARDALNEKLEPYAPRVNRYFTVCRPKEGNNPLHFYRPPFGLHQYDERFR